MRATTFALFIMCTCAFASACVDETELEDVGEEIALTSEEIDDQATEIGAVPDGTSVQLGSPYCLVYTDSGPSGRVLSVSRDYEYLKAVSSGSWIWNTWNDVISAVDCRNGAYLYVYEHSYFQGRCRRLSGYIPTLHLSYYSSIGDRISSIGFMHQPTSCPAW